MKTTTQIINEIIIEMTEKITKEELQSLSDVLNDKMKHCVVITEKQECDTMEKSFEILQHFIEFKKTYKTSKNTLKAYEGYIRAFLEHELTPLLYITEEHVRDYLFYKQKTISPVSVNNIRHALSSFFGWCFDFEYITKNPCTKNLVPPLKNKQTIRHDISQADLIMVKDAAKEIEGTFERLRAIALVDFLESTGCRVAEVANMKISDIDFNRNRVHILGKGEKERTVFMSPACIKHLLEFLRYKEEIGRSSVYVFSNKTIPRLNKPMHLRLLEDIVKNLGEKCGINRLTIHVFRRYFATSNHRKVMDNDTLRLLMGHSSYQTTLGYIAQDEDDMLAKFSRVC